MRHNIYLQKEIRIVGVIVILSFVTLLSIIAVMWIHIKIQQEIILDLKMEISALSCYREADKSVIRGMCLDELFERIDSNNKATGL